MNFLTHLYGYDSFLKFSKYQKTTSIKYFLSFFLWLGWALFPFYLLSAQSIQPIRYTYESLGVKQGLTASELYTVYQDKQGFIWVGTNVGTSRYDGHTFQNYTQVSGERIGLINRIIEDRQGTLWLGGKNGLFYFSEGIFHQVKGANYLINDLQQDQQGRLWVIGTSFLPFYIEELDLEASKNGQALIIQNPIKEAEWINIMHTERVWALDIDEQNNVYFGNDHQLSYFDGQKLHLLWESEKRLEFYFIAATSPDSIYAGGNANFFFKVKDGQGSPVTNRLFGAGYQTSDALYSIGGSYIYKTQQDSSISLINCEDFGCDDYWSKDIFLDREKNFWIATYDGGLLKFTPVFIEVFSKEEYPVLSTNFSLAQIDTSLLIGAHRGRVLEKKGAAFVPYFPETPHISYKYGGGVRDFHLQADGSIWFATEQSGLVLHQNGQFKNFKKENEKGLADNNHFFLFASDNGKLWSGNNGGITQISYSSEGFPVFKNIAYTIEEEKNIRNTAPNYNSYPTFLAMAEDPWGTLWLASSQGLFYLKNNQLKRFTFIEVDPSLIDISIDPEGQIWLSTLGEGIWEGYLNGQGGLEITRKWTMKDGLVSNVFLALHLDKKNRLWMASIAGICYLENGNNYCFDYDDGWMNVNSQQLKMLETTKGDLWTVGYTALARLPLYDLPLNQLAPQALITDIELLDGKEDIFQYATGKQEYGLPQNLVLPYNKNLLRFYFASSSQTHPDKNKFRFQLEGIDSDWQIADNTHNVAYPNLPAGDYVFKLSASNNDNYWSTKVSEFNFTINPPWWRTYTAYAAYIAMFISALVLARRQIIQRESLKNQLKVEQLEKEKVQEIDQLRTRFFANISHEFRTPLTLIKAPLEDLLMSKKSDEERAIFYRMHQNTERLLELVNQLLDLAKLESGILDLEETAGDINSFLRQLAGNFSSLAKQKQINFTIDLPTQEWLIFYDADKIEKIVLNLLSNAFKFTPTSGWVRIRATYQEQLSLYIGNNGSKIPIKEQEQIFNRFYQSKDTRHQGSGIGLALVRELVELYGGTIKVSSTVQETWFSIQLPLREVTTTSSSSSSLNTSYVASTLPMISEPLISIAEQTSPKDAPLLLLTEDQTEVRAYIKSKLAIHFRIIEAENGVEGLALAIEQVPDLIISDVMMPEMDGVRFCAAIKKDHRTDHIPVILLTAKTDIESKLKGLETGADDYLAKPFNSQELLLRTQNLIEQRKKLRARFGQSVQAAHLSKLDSAEDRFIKKAIKVVQENLGNADFLATDFAEAMLLSRAQLHRKLKSITDHSATDFVRQIRLEEAAKLLTVEADSVTQIAYQVGFNNLSYFAKCFREKYHTTPSEYLSNKKRNYLG